MNRRTVLEILTLILVASLGGRVVEEEKGVGGRKGDCEDGKKKREGKSKEGGGCGRRRHVGIKFSIVNIVCCYSVNVSVRRCGGAYGGKITRDAANSTACAVAAYVMNRYGREREHHDNLA